MREWTVIIGVSGGIAAYKAASLCSALVKQGIRVQVIMTEGATRFVAPLTFQSITRNRVVVDVFEEFNPREIQHIALADAADLLVVAPATANVIGKVAHGIADDLLTTTIMATTAPVLFAPAMNVHMYENPIVQENLRALRRHGYWIADPGEGPLACGYTGKGRLAEPEELVEMVTAILHRKNDLAGKRFLVTAGATREKLDPVRFFSNRSTGKMGYAIAEMAVRRGAEVTLITGPTELPAPPSVRVVDVETALEMRDAVLEHLAWADALVMTAAVADYRPKVVSPTKIKKSDGPVTVEFVRNPDILQEVREHRRKDQWIVGFAAETDQVEENARAKLQRKGLDMIVANDVSQPRAGFASDTNVVSIFEKDGTTTKIGLASKREIADRILDRIALRWGIT
jgi:phosphopantothenoylcysteine decarboxylase/phosphopantothenate--cysteine ligase